MSRPFADRLQDYTRSLNEAERALQVMNFKEAKAAADRATEAMVGMLQDLDHRAPANDA